MQLKTTFIFAVILTFSFSDLLGQIRLNNPSFEDEPAASSTPRGWNDCGKVGETPPDTQPNSIFKVFKKAKDGATYIGLVTRDTDTWEAVGQFLETSLEAGQCYDFAIHLARSESYLSRKRTDTTQVQFTQPIRLRIWGGNNYCDKAELLDETGIVEHTAWKKYDFKLNPLRNYQYLTLEAYYMTPTLVAYNGNILVDNCSAIMKCGQAPIAVAEKPKTKPKKDNFKPNETPKSSKKTPSTNTPKPDPEPPVVDAPKTDPTPITPPVVEPPAKVEEKPILVPELKNKTFKEGQIIQVNSLTFPADSVVLTNDSRDVLDEVYDFLLKNPAIVIEIGGHTNNIPPDDYCNKLSSQRAQRVGEYLVEKGIEANRIAAKGYGKTKPIASNKTLIGRKRNQRVEIKIMSVSGVEE